jgi:hypothetical protein
VIKISKITYRREGQGGSPSHSSYKGWGLGERRNMFCTPGIMGGAKAMQVTEQRKLGLNERSNVTHRDDKLQ